MTAMKILIVAPNWIGDTVAAQPLFMRLKAVYPKSEIHALAPAWVAPALRAMPEITSVIDSPFGHGELKLIKRWRLARSLRARGFDAAYVLPNSAKSALIPWMAGIPQRIGFKGEARYGLINSRHLLDEKALPLQVERYAQLAEPLGMPLARPLPNPRLRVDEASAKRTLAVLGLENEARPVVFCPGAEFGPAKRWPETHFAELARTLQERGIPVWILGSRKDAEMGYDLFPAFHKKERTFVQTLIKTVFIAGFKYSGISITRKLLYRDFKINFKTNPTMVVINIPNRYMAINTNPCA